MQLNMKAQVTLNIDVYGYKFSHVFEIQWKWVSLKVST